jgi:hypothetical protein
MLGERGGLTSRIRKSTYFFSGFGAIIGVGEKGLARDGIILSLGTTSEPSFFRLFIC